MDLFTRFVVIAYGYTIAVVFWRLGRSVRTHSKNGDAVREPIMYALAWMGFVIGTVRLINWPLSLDAAIFAVRLSVVVATLPVVVLAFGLMRRYWKARKWNS